MKSFWHSIIIPACCFHMMVIVTVDAAEEDKPKETDKAGIAKTSAPVKTLEVIERPYLNNEKQLMLDIAKSSPTKQVQWLKTANGDEFLTLFTEQLTANPYGSVVLLHSRSTIFTKNLSHDLSEHGWNTLTVFLPELDKEDHRLPAHIVPGAFEAKATTLKQKNSDGKNQNRTVTEENSVGSDMTNNETTSNNTEDSKNVESLNSDTPDATATNDISLLTSSSDENSSDNTLSEADSLIKEEHSLQNPTKDQPTLDIVMNRINAAYKFIADQGNSNIVVLAESIHASWALCDLNFRNNNNLEPDISALVMINSLNLFDSPELTLSYLISKQHLPILDIYRYSIGAEKRQAKTRLNAAKRAKLDTFHQVQMSELSYNWLNQNSPLSKRIRGWLLKYAMPKKTRK